MRSRIVACVLLASAPALARPSVVAKADIDGDAWLLYGKVFVDGVKAPDLVHENGTWESLPVSVEPGRHVVRVELDDGRTQQRAVNVADGGRDVVTLHFPPLELGAIENDLRETASTPKASSAPPAKKETAPAWVALLPLGLGVIFTAVGIASVADGVSAHANSLALESKANAQSPGSCTTPSPSSTSKACAKAARFESRSVPDEVGGGLFIGLGAAVVTASVVAFVLSLEARHEAKRAWNVTPLLSPELAGLGFVTRF